MGMMKYEGMKESGQSLNDLLQQMPRSLQMLFGGGDLNSAIGFYSVVFLYLLLLGAIHAVMLGCGIISKEEQDKTYEFILSKPVSRNRLLSFKFLAVLTNIIILNLVIFISSGAIMIKLGEPLMIMNDLLEILCGLFIIQLLFVTLGSVFASIKNFPKKASALSMTILLSLFMMSIFANMFELPSFLRYITPFNFFDARAILAEGINIFYMVVVLALTGGLTCLSFHFYNKRDLGC
jgi:ABC-2 type transport system permease protein